eukprot:gene45867-61305_t
MLARLHFTNRRNKGLISVDLVYKGFIALSARKATKFGVGPKPIATRKHKERWISSLSSIDSDLEAFSHYPADGSFGALVVQPTP